MEEMNKKAPAKEKKSLLSRIGHFFRSYKSETKKIVWCPWKQVRKSSLVVLAIVIAFTVVICALDFGFSWGLNELRDAVNPTSGTQQEEHDHDDSTDADDSANADDSATTDDSAADDSTEPETDDQSGSEE